MRSYRRQIQELWFCEFEEELVGMNTVKIFKKPEKHLYSVSATAGYVYGWGAGLSLQYDRYITSYKGDDYIPKEGTMVFVDVVPEFDENGELKSEIEYLRDESGEIILDEDNEPTITKVLYSTPPDYTVEKILNTLRGDVARFAIKKV